MERILYHLVWVDGGWLVKKLKIVEKLRGLYHTNAELPAAPRYPPASQAPPGAGAGFRISLDVKDGNWLDGIPNMVLRTRT